MTNYALEADGGVSEGDGHVGVPCTARGGSVSKSLMRCVPGGRDCASPCGYETRVERALMIVMRIYNDLCGPVSERPGEKERDIAKMLR